MAKTKTPFDCKCGEKDPEKFRDGNKSTCYACIVIRQRKKNARCKMTSKPPRMSPEEQKALIDKPIVSFRLLELREMLNG